MSNLLFNIASAVFIAFVLAFCIVEAQKRHSKKTDDEWREKWRKELE